MVVTHTQHALGDDFPVTDTDTQEATVNAASKQKRQTKKAKLPLSSKQQLSATIKSVRDLLRKDAGLAGDTDRLPQLTWLLFLKSLDDFEIAQDEMYGDDYTPIIAEPYRWRDWAACDNLSDRKTGDELLAFVNNDLTNYLKALGGESNRDIRTIVGTIFQGTYNRLRSGYLLRDVVNKLSTINFNSSDDIHAISLFYETMLKEMRDSAGDSGEFYTPRPVVRFIVDRLNPQLGERIMDPACGTAGFLIEAYTKMREQVKTTEHQQTLFDALIGIEKKPMSYLLAIMNLLLHGIENPNIRERNALAVNVNQIPDNELVDVIATNPPFGGEEEDGIIKNFPAGMRTHETALLFFQYIMALLKRPGGRAGVVLPNGFLFGNGIASTVKARLLKQFNLHTIVRLPVGTFAPYTSIPTNILFFDACEESSELDPKPCTQEVWYYEIPLPEGRKSYSKTKPMQNEDFQGCIDWWEKRVENEHAWKVNVEELIANGYNLDMKNPNGQKELVHLPPEQLVESILEKEQRIVDIMGEIKRMLGESNK
ncbi:class I SAM-dependent DNA methyltransferase [Dictyobacter arantiisoli]|uniref:site-specific DNA-methyltransferase (adenine-specific) n=1 Tax=Dictyobacter arantiisoli TaxID=2014874 RepID=A0A5A5TEN4_9CHLR|nr:class I SAM-dependent DNA methyltransferase [Dictyobacter arantiisoli]GCF09606.1 restriction endonuclease EcoEI subunit M [Dictyobacter arantiisoli]